jgi:hypothetical protein
MRIGLEGRGFIIAIGVTLLISGIIVYFCNSRIQKMEKAVVKQNQILGDFITNVKASVMQNTLNDNNDNPLLGGASESAIQAAHNNYSNTNSVGLITVSDDEDDDDSSDDDGSSDDDSSDDDDDDKKEIVDVNKLPELQDMKMDEIITLSREITPPTVKTVTLGDILNEEHLEQVASGGSLGSSSELSSMQNDVSTNMTTDSQQFKHGNLDIKKIKVTELRNLAVTSGVVSEDVAKKMKKADLVKTMQKSNTDLD